MFVSKVFFYCDRFSPLKAVNVDKPRWKEKSGTKFYCVRKQHTSLQCWVPIPPFIFKPLCGYLCEYFRGYLWTSFSSRVFHQIVGFFIELRTSRSNDMTATRTSLKKWICLLLVFVTHLLSQMQANPPGVEFLRTIWKFRKKKKISSFLGIIVYVLHNTRN